MQHRVFVYGTLKQGYPNFHINEGRRVGGDFVTVERFALWVLVEGGLPWLMPEPGEGEHVTGQVYEVDDASLARMDVLEQIDEPGWYLRQRIRVVPAGGGEVIEPWVYFGDSQRGAAAPKRFGPLAEYTPEHAKTYRNED